MAFHNIGVPNLMRTSVIKYAKFPQTFTPHHRQQPKQAERQHNSNPIPCHGMISSSSQPSPDKESTRGATLVFPFSKKPFSTKSNAKPHHVFSSYQKMPRTPVVWQSKTALQNTMPEQQRPDMRGSTVFTLSLVDRSWLTVWTRDALCPCHLQRR